MKSTKRRMYKLTVEETGEKSPKYLYRVVDTKGMIWCERRSSRVFVAATTCGQYFFGRKDLVFKGKHGEWHRWMLMMGEEPSSIAYKE